MHGDNNGLVLKWSNAKSFRDRVPENRLTGIEIKSIKEWNKKIIVSGACSSAKFATCFLEAGAEAVIAPDIPIDWTNLGEFFSVFYTELNSKHRVDAAMNFAIDQFPEFESYHIYKRH
jgi:hypothetical protein